MIHPVDRSWLQLVGGLALFWLGGTAWAEGHAATEVPPQHFELLLVGGPVMRPDPVAEPLPSALPYFRRVCGANTLGVGLDEADLRFLSAFSHLSFVDLTKAGLVDDQLAFFASFTRTRSLILAENQRLTGEGLWHLRNLSELEELYLSKTGISDSKLHLLRLFSRLKIVTFDGTSVDGTGLDGVSLPSLEALSFQGTPFTDAGIKALCGFRGLQFLSLRNTAVTGSGLRFMAFPRLQRLDLQDCPLTLLVAPREGELPVLRTLHLWNTGVDDRSLPAIAQLKALELLSLDGTKVTGEGLSSLTTLPGLKHLDLRRTPLQPKYLRLLVGCRALKSLVLSPEAAAPEVVAELKAANPELLVDSPEGQP